MKKIFFIWLFTTSLYGMDDPYVRPIIEGSIKVRDGKILFPHNEALDFDELHTKLQHNAHISYLKEFFEGKDLALAEKMSQEKSAQSDEEKDLSSYMQLIYSKIVQIAQEEEIDPQILFKKHVRALKNQREEYLDALTNHDEIKLAEVLSGPLRLGDFY